MRVGAVLVSREIEEYIVGRCMEAGAEGHRGEIFLLHACRAYAAYCGEKIVAEKHVDEVLPLVLSHRVRPAEEADERGGSRTIRRITTGVSLPTGTGEQRREIGADEEHDRRRRRSHE